MKIVLLPVSVYILDDRSLVLACGDEDYFWSEFDSALSRVELSRTTGWLFVVTLWFLPRSLFFSSSVCFFIFIKKNSHPKLFPGDIVEYPRNKYFSHFGVYYGERDGVPYVAHLTCRGWWHFLRFYLSTDTWKKSARAGIISWILVKRNTIIL